MKKKLTLFLALCLPACAQFNFFTALSTWKGSTDTNLLQLWLPLNEASGDAIASVGPNFTQSGTVGALSPGRGTYTTNDYFSHSDSFAPNMASNSFTITAWVKSTYFYTNNGSAILESGNATNWFFRMLGPFNDAGDDANVYLYMRNQTNGTQGVGLANFVTNASSWNFIVAQWDLPNSKTYVSVNVDGSATNTITTPPYSPSGQTFKVGTPVDGTGVFFTGSPFTGYIQHLRVFTRLLSGTELTNLYNGGTPN